MKPIFYSGILVHSFNTRYCKAQWSRNVWSHIMHHKNILVTTLINEKGTYGKDIVIAERKYHS